MKKMAHGKSRNHGKNEMLHNGNFKSHTNKKKRRIELLKVYTIPEGKNGEKADSDNGRTCV